MCRRETLTEHAHFCLSASLFVRLSACLSVCLSVRLSVCPYVPVLVAVGQSIDALQAARQDLALESGRVPVQVGYLQQLQLGECLP